MLYSESQQGFLENKWQLWQVYKKHSVPLFLICSHVEQIQTLICYMPGNLKKTAYSMPSECCPKLVCLKTGHKRKCVEIAESTNCEKRLNALCVNLSIHIFLNYNWLCSKLLLRWNCLCPSEFKVKSDCECSSHNADLACVSPWIWYLALHITFLIAVAKYPPKAAQGRRLTLAQNLRYNPSRGSTERKVWPQKFEARSRERWMPAIYFLSPFYTVQDPIP